MNPEEIEFLGEKQLVSIIPSFVSEVMHLISGDFGPFHLGIPIKVPLWFAVILKNQQKCNILPPEWMDVTALDMLRHDETVSKQFTKMPSEHYIIEAKLLLECACDDIPQADKVRTLVKDIWDIRMSKLRSSVDLLVRNNGSYAAVDNLTVMEINSMRPLLPHGLEQIYRMKTEQTGAADLTRTLSMSNSRSSNIFLSR